MTSAVARFPSVDCGTTNPSGPRTSIANSKSRPSICGGRSAPSDPAGQESEAGGRSQTPAEPSEEVGPGQARANDADSQPHDPPEEPHEDDEVPRGPLEARNPVPADAEIGDEPRFQARGDGGQQTDENRENPAHALGGGSTLPEALSRAEAGSRAN